MAPGFEDAPRIAAQASERFGAFLRERVNPGAAERDRTSAALPAEVLRDAAALGLMTLPLAREHGGEGLDLFSWGVILEELGSIAGELAFVQLLGAAPLLARLALDAARPDLAPRRAAWAYSDDADAFHFRSRAEPKDGGWVLDGAKPIVTGATSCEGAWVYVARPGGDLCAFWVERTDPGVEITPLASSGLRSSGLGRLHLRSVTLREDRLLVPADGLSHAQRYLNLRRVTLAATVVGFVRGVLTRGIAQLQATLRYERPVTELANVQSALGRLQASVWSAQALSRSALLRFAQGTHDPLWDARGSAAKYVAVETALEVTRTLERVLGGRGYLAEQGFERQRRDLEGLIAGAGAQDALEVDLGAWTTSPAARAEGRA